MLVCSRVISTIVAVASVQRVNVVSQRQHPCSVIKWDGVLVNMV